MTSSRGRFRKRRRACWSSCWKIVALVDEYWDTSALVPLVITRATRTRTPFDKVRRASRSPPGTRRDGGLEPERIATRGGDATRWLGGGGAHCDVFITGWRHATGLRDERIARCCRITPSQSRDI